MRFRSDEPEPRLLDEPREPEADRPQLQIVPVAAPTRPGDLILITPGATAAPPLPRRARRASTRH